MRTGLIFSFFILSISNAFFAQNYSCIKFQSKIRTDKVYTFKLGSVATMKVKDSTFIIPLITNLTLDSITIQKRIYISESKIAWEPLTFPLMDLVWINWDGIPRKKIRVCRYFVSIE